MRVRVLLTMAALLASVAAMARAEECDTGNPCMANGMCMPDGSCEGTPITGGNCDLSDLTCMANGHCVSGACIGEPAPDGANCAGGCGTCQPIFPGVPVTQCKPDPAQLGRQCETSLGSCFVGTCMQFGTPPVVIAQCFPHYMECPDIDGNPCTTDACNPASGQCEHLNQSPCVPHCETCNPATGCAPINIGTACDLGFQPECPVETSCQVFSGRGICAPGTPSSVVPTPTFTPTPVLGPPTPTPPPGGCIGDCGGTGVVAVNNIITLVNIDLGNADVSACPHGIPSSGEVNVAVIIKAVNNALNGCA